VALSPSRERIAVISFRGDSCAGLGILMGYLKYLGAAALMTLSSGAFAADLVAPAKEAPQLADPVGTGFYVEVFGGAKLAGEVDYTPYAGCTDAPDALTAGLAYGGPLGVNPGISGLSVELDVLHASSAFTNDANTSIVTTSLMANAKYTFKLTDSFDVYGAAGVGAIHATSIWHTDTYVDATAAGYQLIAGVGANITPNISLFGEYRFQDSFAPFPSTNPPQWDKQSFPTNVVLAGVKLSTD